MFDISQAITLGTDWFVPKPALEKKLEWQLIMLAVMSVLAVGVVIAAARISRRIGNRYPLAICAGAVLATFYEPLGDLFAHVTYHEVGQISLTSAFGFRTPLWIVPTYVVFFGASTLWLMGEIEKGVTQGRWMLLYALSLPGAWLFEVPLLRMGAISYYGDNQPLQLFGYPLWMAFANSTTIFVVATACSFLKRSPAFRERPLLFTPFFPMLVMGANGACALPLGSSINSAASLATVNAAAGLSMVLALFYTWIAGSLVAVPSRDLTGARTFASSPRAGV